MTDEQLAAAIRAALAAARAAGLAWNLVLGRQHEQRAKDLKMELWMQLQPWLRKRAQRFRPYAQQASMDEDDLIQEGWSKFNKVIEHYDPGKGAKVRTWLDRILTNYWIQEIRKRRGEPTGHLPEMPVPGPKGPPVTPSRVKQVLSKVLPRDPQRHEKILVWKLYRLAGWTIPELARRFGHSTSTIHEWIKQVDAAFLDAWRGEFPD